MPVGRLTRPNIARGSSCCISAFKTISVLLNSNDISNLDQGMPLPKNISGKPSYPPISKICSASADHAPSPAFLKNTSAAIAIRCYDKPSGSGLGSCAIVPRSPRIRNPCQALMPFRYRRFPRLRPVRRTRSSLRLLRPLHPFTAAFSLRAHPTHTRRSGGRAYRCRKPSNC